MRFREADIEVFGVNPSSMKSHQRFSDRHNFSFPLLVDEGGEVTLAYGAKTLHNLVPLRTVVGIDKAGTVIYYQRGMPSTDAILAAMTGGESLAD